MTTVNTPRSSSLQERTHSASCATWSRRGRGWHASSWAIVRREFVERVRTRWFWIGALLGPVLFGVVFFLSGQLGRGGGVKRIAIVDGTTTRVGARLAEQLDQSGAFQAVRVPVADGVVDSLTAEVRTKRLDGFLIVT